MPSGSHHIQVDIPIERVWSFVSDMDHWAPLIKGYVNHEKITTEQSTWTFKGEVGMVQKTVHAKINIIEWVEPHKITFDLIGVNENFQGNGYFRATMLNGHKTKITSQLTITAKGILGPVANRLLTLLVPKTTRELTEAIAKKLMKLETAALTT